MKIGIIGGGEVGRAYAEALVTQTDHQVTVSDPDPRDELIRVAEATGLTLVAAAGTWLGEMDRIWLCVTGDLAPSVCRELLEYVKPGTIILDLTTATPEAKRGSHDLALAQSVDYVDTVILGAVATTRARTPLLAAGATAEAATREFVELGAPVKTLPQAGAGDAAALKLLRTILTKGMEALAVECLVAAERQGVRAELYEAMADVDTTGFTNFLDMLVTTHIQHCTRRLHEVERAETQLMSLGLPASMLAASQQVFTRTMHAQQDLKPPANASADVSAALAWLSASVGKTT